jgi:hypothetical protein
MLLVSLPREWVFVHVSLQGLVNLYETGDVASQHGGRQSEKLLAFNRAQATLAAKKQEGAGWRWNPRASRALP